MTINTIKNGGDITVKPIGRLDSTTAGEFDKAMKAVLSDALTSLAIDMTDVDFISSMGLRVLVSAYKELNGKPLTLISPNASVIEVLRLSGLLQLMAIK